MSVSSEAALADDASAPIRNAMTVDVEDYFHVSGFAGVIKPSEWNRFEYRGEVSTRRLLGLFDEFGVSATFFVLGWMARRSPGLIREIHAAGHEVACHGMSHELVYRQTTEDFTRETRDSKSLLEDVIGAPVHGYRAASWSITQKSLWALDAIHEIGFRYDSSVFPIVHDRYGIPGAPQYPGVMVSPSGHEIVEFPPSTVMMFGARIPVAGGGYFRLLPYWLTRTGLRKINREISQPFIFYIHPWELDPKQPRVSASWLSRFRHYTNLQKTESRLRQLLADFRFTTANRVLEDAGLLSCT